MGRSMVAALLACVAWAAPAEIRVAAVAVSSDFTAGLPDYGSLGSIFCTGLEGVGGVRVAETVPLPFEIAGVSVAIGGVPAPLLAVADFGPWQQINFQMPGVQAANRDVEVRQSGRSGLLANPPRDAWGVFFIDQAGYAVAQHAGWSLVTPAHPARPGEIVVVYATSLDSYAYVNSMPAIGDLAPADPLPSLFPSRVGNGLRIAPSVTVNGKPARQFYSGLTPGSIGVFQVNFRVPEDTPPGDAVLQAMKGTCLPIGGCGTIDWLYSRTAKLPVGAIE